MHIKQFSIKNYKSFKELTIHLNSDLNIFTGVNNSGKTTVLEAISLWHECFIKLIHKANTSEKNYRKGDYILGPSYNKNFRFDQIYSISSPYMEDIFHQRTKKNAIQLKAEIENESGDTIEIPFSIQSSGSDYSIAVVNYSKYSFRKFNNFFRSLPEPVGLVYSSPVSSVPPQENFSTDPNIQRSINERKSVNTIRNRIYKILNSPDQGLASQFMENLNYILYNYEKKIELISTSKVQTDTRVLISYRIGERDSLKDISLLGSGSLQIIELLLNIYQPGERKKELNLILLDEPDSHIHRDIQKRLLDVFRLFSSENQLFITTHNESFIRTADYMNIFHLSGKAEDVIHSVIDNDLSANQPHFKGIFPSPINTVIRSIGSTSGLDFVNAIECDKLIFVEGEDDAKVISILLKQQLVNRKKYMFWVMGGISEIFKNIGSYRAIFSNIRNEKTLWEKSCLVFDRDFLSDEDKANITREFANRLALPTFSCNSYTFESSVLTDFDKLSSLLKKWIDRTGTVSDKNLIESNLIKEYQDFKTILVQRYNEAFYNDTAYRYRDVRDKTGSLLEHRVIRETDIQLNSKVRMHINESIDKGYFYKLMTKDDVGLLIQKVINYTGLTFSIETDFIELIKLVDKSLWFKEWDFINTI